MVTNRTLRGISTFELLIAFAILTLAITAVISMLYGNQSAAVDTQTGTEAMYRAQQLVENERALAKSNFLSASTTSSSETIGTVTYTKTITVSDLTPCKKVATTTVSWNSGTIRPQKVELVTYLTDVAGALLMGGDCFVDIPTKLWNAPTRFASDTFNPGKPLAIDVLERYAYVAEDKSPFLLIANTNGATLGQSSGLFVSYTNGFSAGNQINALDTIRYTNPATGAVKYYVFAAMNSTSNQLAVIDVTTKTAPTVVTTVSLSSCVTGSFPQGWYVAAYGNRLYLTTRETSGPELHIFDITTPTSPTELGSGSCKGFEQNDTVEQFVVRDQVINGTTKRYLYEATDESNKEIRVIDVTSPTAVSEVRSIDLSGTNDAMSVYAIGSKLYVGRMSGTGNDLLVYNIDNPVSSMTLLGGQDIGTDVLGIRVAGNLLFMATGKTNQEFQVWNVKNVGSITNVTTYNFGNVVGSGIDYEPDFIYATGQSTPNFQILYSPT